MKVYRASNKRPALAAACLASIAALAVAAGGCGPREGSTDSGPTGPICGNSIIEMGEDCDPPVGGECTTMCAFIPVCGNDRVEGSEECDPPNGTDCSVMCRIITQTTPNIGAPCMVDEDCNGGPFLAGRCNTEAMGFPAGFCDAPDCAEGQCPTGSTCVTFTGGVTSCYPDCTTTGVDNGGCRPETADGVAYACFPLGTFVTDAAICVAGCDDDTACAPGNECEETTNVCVPSHPAAVRDPLDVCTFPGGACADDGSACTGDPDCSGTCNRPAGTCVGDPLMACLVDTDCTATCNLTFGFCAVGGAPCTAGSCGIHLCDVAITGTCVDDGTVTCTSDADCEACNLASGFCSGAGVPCTTDATCNVCNYPAGACTDDLTSCLADGDCLDVCNLSAGGCALTGGACTVDDDCTPGIGDPCTSSDDCPQYAVCRTGAGFPGGYCSILYCGSFPGIPEFTCPAGSFCPAATPFNGGTVNFCTPTCTLDPLAPMNPDVECDANRGDNNDYICTEQDPDDSTTGLSDFFDTPSVPGFCLPCVNYWADVAECPTPAN